MRLTLRTRRVNNFRIAEQRSVRVVKNCGKTGRGIARLSENSNIYFRIVVAARIAFLSLPGPELKQNQQAVVRHFDLSVFFFIRLAS